MYLDTPSISTSRIPLFLIGLFFLFGCQPDAPSTYIPAELHQALLKNQLKGNDSERRAFLAEAAMRTNAPDSLAAEFIVYRAENAYETLHYEEALKLSRKAMALMQQHPSATQLPSLFRTANLLGKLHYEHWNFVDSITFYSHLAHELRQQLPPSNALDLELSLLKFFDQRANYLFPEIDAGIAQLAATDTYKKPALYDTKAQLKILRAISIRKQRLEVFTKEGRDSLFGLSLANIKEAIDLYQEQQSPRLSHALAEFGLHQSRLGSDEEFTAARKAINEQKSSTLPVRYGYEYRLQAMRASKDGLAAALPYYREVFPKIPPFNVALKDEAAYVLEEVAKEQKNHQRLWSIAIESLFDGRCASLEVLLPKELTAALPQTNVCHNILIDLAVAKRIEYEQTGSLEALELAEQYNDFLLRRWAEDRSGSNERSLLYQLFAFGAEGLDNAIVTNYHRYERDKKYGLGLSLFKRMEANRSLILRRDMAERNQVLRTPRFLLEDSLSLIQDQLSALTFARTTAGEGFQEISKKRFTNLTKLKSYLQQRINKMEASENTGMLFNITLPTKAQLAKEGILSFSWTNEGLFALALNDRQSTTYRIDTKGLITEIDSLRTLLNGIRPNQATIIAYQEMAASLYLRLLQPAAAILPRGTPLLIIPDKHLSKLPFEALLTEVVSDPRLAGQSPFFLHRNRIRYAPSWAVDQQARPLSPILKGETSVAVLTHTQLHGYFAETHQLLRNNADHYQEHVGIITTSGLQQLATQAGIFHLSAHAEGDPKKLQNNFIHLSPTEKINAAEVETLDLSERLVVMAACETGLGQQRDGEGVYTISRSFRLAGASGVISSLWQVKGLPTQALLKEFYRLLFSGMSPTDALWAAKTRMACGKLAKREYWWPGSWAGVVG